MRGYVKAPRPARELRPEWLGRAQRGLSWALGVVLAIVVLAHCERGTLVEVDAIRPELRQEPRQTPTTRPETRFEFAGEIYRVRPVAEYELWGLVVTHNDTEGFGDIYHDETSVDTKDLCVIWGTNVEREDYRRIDYWSRSFECWWSSPPGVVFDPSGLGNNHLITDSEAVREAIADVRVGDQVHVRGALVDYQAESHPEFWRRSSTTRDDTGGGACEVVFVDALEVLERGTPVWYALAGFGWWLVGALVLAKIGLFAFETRRGYVSA